MSRARRRSNGEFQNLKSGYKGLLFLFRRIEGRLYGDRDTCGMPACMARPCGGHSVPQGRRECTQQQRAGHRNQPTLHILLLPTLLLFPFFLGSTHAQGCIGDRYRGPFTGQQSKVPRVVAIISDIESPEECGKQCNSQSFCKRHTS